MPSAFTATRPMQGGNGKGATRDCGRATLHETADGYHGTLAASGRWRAIRCRDDLQFILQRRRGGNRKWPWQAVAYILNARALPPVLHRPSLGIPAADLARLMAALPRPAMKSHAFRTAGAQKMRGPRHD
jgi:hypothetical protein